MIDAFHIVHGAEVGVRFFLDERSGGGIRLTDTLYNLKGRAQWENLEAEVEARWRLVETAWDLNMPRYALTVEHETDTGLLVPDRKRYARRAITGSREALSGYQKGTCFYCFADLSLKGDTRAEVDHFFPHKLKPCGVARSLDGVWNLVLACWSCNAGPGGKFDRLPHVRYLERLHDRNEYLIGSHHPLRETLIKQTGATEDKRRAKLQRDYTAVQAILITTWQAPYENAPTF